MISDMKPPETPYCNFGSLKMRHILGARYPPTPFQNKQKQRNKLKTSHSQGQEKQHQTKPIFQAATMRKQKYPKPPHQELHNKYSHCHLHLHYPSSSRDPPHLENVISLSRYIWPRPHFVFLTRVCMSTIPRAVHFSGPDPTVELS